MIARKMQETARVLWMSYPVLTVTGPRQSGKTTLVRMTFPECAYVNLETPDVRAEAIADEIGDCRVVYSGRVASGSEDIPFVPFDQMRLQ